MGNDAGSNTIDARRSELAALQNPVTGNLGAGATASAQPPLGIAVQAPGSPPVLATSETRVAAEPEANLQGASLLASLTRIQRGDLSALSSGDLALAASLAAPGMTNVLRELRGTSLASGLGHIDSVTLDIVALLFDRIFAYEKIPPLLKGQIGQLQIPMLKVAILDKGFFYKKSHSARKLLDCLGDIAVSLNADFDASSPLYRKVQGSVRELVNGFQDSMDIFDRLHEELERFVAGQSQCPAEQAEVLAKRIEYKERLALAKVIAQREILKRAKCGNIPCVVLRFLADQWIKVMLIAYAKHGNESEAWNTAVATMDLLIWSVREKRSLVERRTLAAVLPMLLKRLSNGMRKIGIAPDDRKRFFIKLMSCHTRALSPALFKPAGPADPASKPHAPAVAPGDDTEPATALPEFHALTVRNPFGEGDVEIEEISLADLPASGTGAATSGDDHLRMAGSLRVGAWVDFRDENGNKRQARLFYVSALRRTYLFVSRQTRNVSEYSLHQLARELRAGRASIIETMPLFERAMGSLVGVRRTGASLQ